MPGKTAVTYGNEIFDGLLYLPSVPFPSITAGGVSDTNFTVPGVLPLDLVSWNIIAPASALAIENAYVSAANTVTFRWSAATGNVTAGNAVVLIEVIRADGANLGPQALPPALV